MRRSELGQSWEEPEAVELGRESGVEGPRGASDQASVSAEVEKA